MSEKLGSGFEVVKFSDLRYKKMTTEIQYKGEQVAQLNLDKGSAKIEVELFREFIEVDFRPIFLVDDFIEALTKAKEILKEYDDPVI